MNRMTARSLFASFLAASILFMGVACKREDPAIRELTQKAAEADKAQQQLNQAGAEQAKKLQQAGVNDIKPNAETLQLTDEQKKALEERIKNEKNSSYQALLQEVLDKDKQIKELNSQVAKLKADLPKPEIAKANDSHYGMAMRFLKKKGIPEAEARRLVSRVSLMEKMAPGFEVYNFYANGVYGTWVTQGKAKITPNDLVKQEREKVEGERDTAIAENEKLQDEVTDLETKKKGLEGDIAALSTEKATLTEQVTQLTTTTESQKSKLNSMHYVVGQRDALKKSGVVELPIFSKDRAGANWADSVFNKDLDLRTNDTLTITAAEVGLKKIGKVSVVPGSLIKDKQYTLTISEDKSTATIKILDKERFLNEKVAFAVSD